MPQEMRADGDCMSRNAGIAMAEDLVATALKSIIDPQICGAGGIGSLDAQDLLSALTELPRDDL